MTASALERLIRLRLDGTCRDITAGQPEPMSKNPNPSHRKIRWAKE